MDYGALTLNIERILKTRGISKNQVCKDLDIPRANFNRYCRNQGIRAYEAGGALGFDALAAQTVIRLRESCPGMKLILVLPCLTQTRGLSCKIFVNFVLFA